MNQSHMTDLRKKYLKSSKKGVFLENVYGVGKKFKIKGLADQRNSVMKNIIKNIILKFMGRYMINHISYQSKEKDI